MHDCGHAALCFTNLCKLARMLTAQCGFFPILGHRFGFSRLQPYVGTYPDSTLLLGFLCAFGCELFDAGLSFAVVDGGEPRFVCEGG